MNIPLLRKVQDILRSPDTVFDMNSWQCCIGGIACNITGTQFPRHLGMMHTTAPWLCDLFDCDSEQAMRLCMPSEWPRKFVGLTSLKFVLIDGIQRPWRKITAFTKEVAIERIEFFIQTNGTDKMPDVLPAITGSDCSCEFCEMSRESPIVLSDEDEEDAFEEDEEEPIGELVLN